MCSSPPPFSMSLGLYPENGLQRGLIGFDSGAYIIIDITRGLSPGSFHGLLNPYV